MRIECVQLEENARARAGFGYARNSGAKGAEMIKVIVLRAGRRNASAIMRCKSSTGPRLRLQDVRDQLAGNNMPQAFEIVCLPLPTASMCVNLFAALADNMRSRLSWPSFRRVG